MKVAPVTDYAYAALMQYSGMQMILAQRYKVSDDVYKWDVVKAQQHGSFVMVDNGEAEGERLVGTEYLDVINEIKPDEVVLPDAWKDHNRTVYLHRNFAEMIPAKYRAICPQGESIEDWMECLMDIGVALEWNFSTICVPKHLEGVEGGRHLALHRIHNYAARFDRYHIHLLGLYGPPIPELRTLLSAENICQIRSLDTGAPVAFAQHQMGIMEVSEHIPMSFESGFFRLVLARENLEALQQVGFNYAHRP
jgi:hypothetical protein